VAFPLELSVLIKDPIYGYVALTDLERRIIETSVFQRLRFITQNGLAFYTYPALRGSRFEHSIGVCHLAGRVMTAAVENSREEVLRTLLSGFCESLETVLSRETYLDLIAECKVDKNELGRMHKSELRELANFMVQLVRLLGLLHDIGHLPFSHLGEEALEPFERELLGQSDFDEFKARNCKLHEYIGYKIITEGIGGLRKAFVNEVIVSTSKQLRDSIATRTS
jgi:HD superfamily phosphohydrolase